MTEQTSTAGNNVFSKNEYNAARSHGLVMHHALMELHWDYKTCGKLLALLANKMKPGVFFTGEVVDQTVDLIREVVEPLRKERDFEIPKALTSELDRAAGALLDLLPIGGPTK